MQALSGQRCLNAVVHVEFVDGAVDFRALPLDAVQIVDHAAIEDLLHRGIAQCRAEASGDAA